MGHRFWVPLQYQPSLLMVFRILPDFFCFLDSLQQFLSYRSSNCFFFKPFGAYSLFAVQGFALAASYNCINGLLDSVEWTHVFTAT